MRLWRTTQLPLAIDVRNAWRQRDFAACPVEPRHIGGEP